MSIAIFNSELLVYQAGYLGMVTMTANGSVISINFPTFAEEALIYFDDFLYLQGAQPCFEHPKEVVPC